MPRYDFVCEYCGHREERSLMLREADTPQMCGKVIERIGPGSSEWTFRCNSDMTRQPSAPALRFKGAGWTPRHYPGK